MSFLKTRNLSLVCAKDAVGSAVIRICMPLGSSGEEGTLWRTRRQGPVLDGAAFAFKILFHPPPLNSLCSQFCSAAFKKFGIIEESREARLSSAVPYDQDTLPSCFHLPVVCDCGAHRALGAAYCSKPSCYKTDS